MKNSEWIDLDRLEQLMKSKFYSELNQAEREWVSQWVESADEYDMMRKSETQIHQYFQDNSVDPPAAETLAQLTSHLKNKSTKQHTGAWWQFKPSFSAWSMAILFGCVGWWMGHATTNSNTLKTDALQSTIVRDTIYIASQPDTVFTERIIYKDRPIRLARSKNEIETSQKPSESNGINMKEKEELEKLLVSGTE